MPISSHQLTDTCTRALQHVHLYILTCIFLQTKAHPPVRVEDRKSQIVNNTVGVVVAVGEDVDSRAEAWQAEIKVGAHCALDPHAVADVAKAVVAVEHSPASTALALLVTIPKAFIA